MDRVDALRIFRRVAETQSFTRVAGELGLSQPTVSRAIAELEQTVGAQLVRRTTRAVSLTEAGVGYHARVLRILEELDAAEAEARGLEAGLVGLLRVQAPLAYGRAVVAGQLARFMARHPHVRVDLLLGDAIVDLAAEGCDLAIRVGELADSSLKARRLGVTRRSPHAAPGYLERAGRPAHPHELAAQRCLVFTRLATPRVWRFAQANSEVQVEVDGPFQSDSLDALRAAAVAGLGIAPLPGWLAAEDVAAGRLERVLSTWTAPATPVHAVWPATREPGAKARAFIDFIATEAPQD